MSAFKMPFVSCLHPIHHVQNCFFSSLVPEVSGPSPFSCPSADLDLSELPLHCAGIVEPGSQHPDRIPWSPCLPWLDGSPGSTGQPGIASSSDPELLLVKMAYQNAHILMLVKSVLLCKTAKQAFNISKASLVLS